MRELLPVPDTLVDPRTGKPTLGSFRGGFRRVDVSPLAGPVARFFTRKRWVYVAIAKPPLLVAACVVDLGYSATAFAFAYDSEQRRLLGDVSAIGMRASMSDTAQEGCDAVFRSKALDVSVRRPAGSTAYHVVVRSRAFTVDAQLDSIGAPPSLTAAARLSESRISTTEKRALLATTGRLEAGGVSRDLDGGLGGYDYTHGLLPRRTRWNWAFLLGTTDRGEPIALNLVEGFMGEAECGAFTPDETVPLSEGRFAFDAKTPLAPWSVCTADGTTSLSFSPGAAHVEKKNLLFVRSRFIQPVGTFSGTIGLGSRRVSVAHALGVVEDQDVLW
jgi:hypothetical protein